MNKKECPRCKGTGTVDQEVDDIDIMVDCPDCNGRGFLYVSASTRNIMIVGEAWGKDEEEAGRPFVGASGRILNGLLSQVGIQRSDCYVTNVFNLRPRPTNDVKNLCGPRGEAVPGMPALASGKWVREEYAPELDRLTREVEREHPNLVIAFGATAAWFFLHTSGIRKIRGATAESHLGVKVLPTYHPAAVMRDWRLRPIVFADLCKAKREAEFPEVRRPQREIWIEPTIADLGYFKRRYIDPSPDLSVDVETIGNQITCFGFAPSIDRALVVPFFDPTKPRKNYWQTKEEELEAWAFVRECCALKKTRFVGQNILYDAHFSWRAYGIPMPSITDDTMLLHHALQPEMDKGLGFLGSVYTDEPAWKLMRKNDTIKRED